jgi:hypothetical protein
LEAAAKRDGSGGVERQFLSIAIYCRKAESELPFPMTNPSLSAGQNREPPFPGRGAPAKGREKFLSAKIQRNPLKLLVSDEEIQGIQ